MHILVTGTAGFIGFHVARRLLDAGHEVTGIDGFTPYYDLALKERRQALLAEQPGFRQNRLMLEDAPGLRAVYGRGFDLVFHFAAQAGVRYSLENPRAYVDANLTGTFNLLECLRQAPPAPCLARLDLLGLWRQSQHSVPRDRPCRSSADALCGDQEGQ